MEHENTEDEELSKELKAEELYRTPESSVVEETIEESGYLDKVVDGADQRSFWTMVLLAIQNAFNDKAAQTFLTALGVFLLTNEIMSSDHSSLSSVDLADKLSDARAGVAPMLSMLILIPFIFLAPLAGWISDRFSKTMVLRGGALMQMLVLGLILVAVVTRQYWLGVVGFGLLALQSTLLSPAKKGVIKEMMGSERLGFASGIVELSSVLAICLGQIISGFVYDSRLAATQSGASASGDAWQAVYWPILILFIFAIPAFLASFLIKVYPSPSKRPFKVSILWEHVGQMKDLLGDSKIRLSALAIGFFWFIGGFVNIVAFQVGSELTAGTTGYGKELAMLLGFASGGMILGGAVASYSSRRSIELGLVPIGGILMVIGCVAMYFVGIDSFMFKFWIGFIGFGAAMFLVPLNAHLQDSCPEKKRGKVIAGSNLLDCLAGALAVAAQVLMTKFGVSIQVQFILIGVLCALVTIYATKILPQHFVRFTILTFVRVFYRQKVLNVSRIPKEGGVLIVPNHVSYMDAFILTAASSRPVRFLMTDEYFKKRGIIRTFLKLFDTVPISDKRAKDAIQKAADAVAEGGVVCIFPEGQLTRSGCMNEIKRGYEMIARKAKCPVIPVYMDGLWGSIFSFERGKFIKKWPYRLPYGVTVNWGDPIPAREATVDRVRGELSKLGMQAFSERAQLERPTKSLRKGRVKVLAGERGAIDSLRQQMLGQTKDEQYDYLYNGLQLSEFHGICRGDVVAIRLDEMGDLKESLGVAFPLLGKLKLVLVSDEITASELLQWHESYGIMSYIGGPKLKAQMHEAGIKDTEFYSLKGSVAEEGVYPVKSVDGKVIAISMPHPIAITTTNQFQAGWKEGAYGRLLPGYQVEADADITKVYLPNKPSAICTGAMDKEGFLLHE